MLKTTCRKCGAVAAETICHLCKEPRPGFEVRQPAPAEAVCFDIFAEIERQTAMRFGRSP